MRAQASIITFLLLLFCSSLTWASTINYAWGIYGGFMPSMGDNLNSYVQEEFFNSRSGIDGMNRKRSGTSTSTIDRLIGVTGGMEIKGIFFDYYFARIAFNYSKSVYGGSGKTVFTPDSTNYYGLKCNYSLIMYDMPLTIGLSIPFWKDMKISLSGGIAYAYAVYENQFKSSETAPPFERKGIFKGWGLPLVIVVEGEYFISEKISLNSTLSYYRGATEVIKDERKSDTDGPDLNNDTITPDAAVDFSRIDFTGYRFTLGVSIYFQSI
jgi:hypothetical protein